MIETIYRIARLLTVLKASKSGLSILLKKGYSIASNELLNNISDYCPTINSVIDVGANQGQFALATVAKFPQAVVYSFEPLPEIYPVLVQNVKQQKHIKTFNLALGSTSGTINFYKNSFSHASSALPISDFQRTNIAGVNNTELIEVQVERLDVISSTFSLPAPVLLKIDVQGFEKEVLLGSEELLAKIDYLVFETSFTPMYDGEPTFDEMHEYVKKLGFEQVAPVGVQQTNTLKILQLDLLYRKVVSQY